MATVKVEERLPAIESEITKTLVVEITATYNQFASIRKSMWELHDKACMDPIVRETLKKMLAHLPYE